MIRDNAELKKEIIQTNTHKQKIQTELSKETIQLRVKKQQT